LGPGQGGLVQVTATEILTLSGTSPDGRSVSGIFANTEGKAVGAGNAGSVIVAAPRVALTEGAEITSRTRGPGQGGLVQVTATDSLTLSGSVTGPDGVVSSRINASAEGAGNAGSVIIEAPRVTLTGGAQIASPTFGPGHGGTVTVTATDSLTLSGTGTNSAGTGASRIIAIGGGQD